MKRGNDVSSASGLSEGVTSEGVEDEAVRTQLRRLRRVVQRIVMEPGDAQTVVTRTLEALIDHTNGHQASLWAVDNALPLLRGGSASVSRPDRVTNGPRPGEVRIVGTVDDRNGVNGKAPGATGELSNPDGRHRGQRNAAALTVAAMPLIGRAGVIGVIEVLADRAHPAPGRLTAALRDVASMLATSLERFHETARLRAEAKRMGAVLDALELPLLVLRPDGEILVGTAAAARLFDREAADLAGDNVTSLIADPARRTFLAELQASVAASAAESGTPQRWQTAGIGRDRRSFAVEWKVHRLAQDDDDAVLLAIQPADVIGLEPDKSSGSAEGAPSAETIADALSPTEAGVDLVQGPIVGWPILAAEFDESAKTAEAQVKTKADVTGSNGSAASDHETVSITPHIGEPRRLLIADGDFSTRRLFALGFSDPSMRVVEAEDGESAWRLINIEKPDVVVVDWHMRSSTGLAFCERIRAHHDLDGLRILVYTSEPVDEVMGAVAHLPNVWYLPKGTGWPAVVTAVNALFSRGDAPAVEDPTVEGSGTLHSESGETSVGETAAS